MQHTDNQDNDTTKTSSNDNSDATEAPTTRTPKIPPIILQDVSSYTKLVKELATLLPTTAFTAMTLRSKAVKISTNTAEHYRTLVKHFRNTNIFFHTYQLKTDRAFKVVLRGLHHSVESQEIKSALEEENFTVRNVVNIRHHKTKEQMPLFFVDLEPQPGVQKIYDLKYLLSSKIQFESPKPRRDPVQCKRCQSYGHTRAYCTRPPICVKCGDDHDTSVCRKGKDEPAHCGLCGGAHTANYRGCEEYKKYSARIQPTTNRHPATQRFIDPTPNIAGQSQSKPGHQGSYADAVRGASLSQVQPSPHPIEPAATSNRIELLLEKITSQNEMLLKLLNLIVSKLL